MVHLLWICICPRMRKHGTKRAENKRKLYGRDGQVARVFVSMRKTGVSMETCSLLRQN